MYVERFLIDKIKRGMAEELRNIFEVMIEYPWCTFFLTLIVCAILSSFHPGSTNFIQHKFPNKPNKS